MRRHSTFLMQLYLHYMQCMMKSMVMFLVVGLSSSQIWADGNRYQSLSGYTLSLAAEITNEGYVSIVPYDDDVEFVFEIGLIQNWGAPTFGATEDQVSYFTTYPRGEIVLPEGYGNAFHKANPVIKISGSMIVNAIAETQSSGAQHLFVSLLRKRRFLASPVRIGAFTISLDEIVAQIERRHWRADVELDEVPVYFLGAWRGVVPAWLTGHAPGVLPSPANGSPSNTFQILPISIGKAAAVGSFNTGPYVFEKRNFKSKSAQQIEEDLAEVLSSGVTGGI